VFRYDAAISRAVASAAAADAAAAAAAPSADAAAHSSGSLFCPDLHNPLLVTMTRPA
jgi:hypothetical protein